MRGPAGFLFRRETVLVAFLVLKALTVTVNGVMLGSTEAWGIGILALLTYGTIVWFASKRQVISIWAISIIMLYEGSGILLAGLEKLASAPGLGVLGLGVAAYLVVGALVIFSGRHERG